MRGRELRQPLSALLALGIIVIGHQYLQAAHQAAERYSACCLSLGLALPLCLWIAASPSRPITITVISVNPAAKQSYGRTSRCSGSNPTRVVATYFGAITCDKYRVKNQDNYRVK
jgi:hypothetical protein